MSNKPVVFISATSDLRSARDLVGRVLYSMGYEPVWQDVAATDGGELLNVLRRRIEPCALVVQLVGGRYGAEPPQPTAEFGRVSYTQFEALYAQKLGRKVIYHFVAPDFPANPAPAEAEELARLQAAYKEKLVAGNQLRQDNIATPGELELSIRRISDELAALRAQSERRARRTLWLIGAALAGVAAVAALVMAGLRQQHKAAVQTQAGIAALQAKQEELAAIQNQLLAAVTPKPLAQGQAKPDPLPPELIEKAKLLLAQGTAEQQALAKIALKQHESANRIIQELKARPGNPIDEAFRLLTLEGDNWYQAGEFDKAIGPYEKAMSLKPDDFKARNSVAIVHIFARLGNIAEHERRAIEVAQGTLKMVRPGSRDWAETQNNLGLASNNMPTGDKAGNLRAAIACYEAALTVSTKAADPARWAITQNNLGLAWSDMPTGDKTENLRKAIAYYEATLAVYTNATDPAFWASTQNNLGNAWQDMPAGDKTENLRKAIACYEAALTVYTKTANPAHWAATQNNLGNAWSYMPAGDKAANLRKAIACYQAALTVRTEGADPTDWATTQNNLGVAWRKLPAGDKTENLRNAIACYQVALTVQTKATNPAGWAMTQNNLGNAWAEMPGRPLAGRDKAENLRKAIACYEAALTVRTKAADPAGWAGTQNNLGNIWRNMPAGDRTENLRKAIACYEAALTIRTKAADPAGWAATQNNLGLAWSNMPTGDKAENLRKAIASHEAALTVFTRTADPVEWAATQIRLGIAWHDMLAGDKVANLRNAIASFKGAQLVYSKEAFPEQAKVDVEALALLREQYDSLPAAKDKPFDAIAPAE